ncbi:hypothetical protein BGZ95_006911 [Linnemannia exigua]|uniref:WD40 repeat-like protein n=1 Tax=Linnemannia exigua TaxID=604196 RepID=A0AAD4H825_9FUNG|nr:hypothetical protein BGZ95_006911 [Linnemannia exigua]
MEPDFWQPPSKLKKPIPKVKGNLIGVPSNSPSIPTISKATSAPNPLQAVKASFKIATPPMEVASSSSRPHDRRLSTSSSVPTKRQHHLSKVDQTVYSSAKEQRAHINLRNSKAVNPTHVSHPGELEGRRRYDDRKSQSGTRDDWYNTAFICYETLALESGHLITSATINNLKNKGLFIWDMKGKSEDAKIALVKLSSEQSGAPWIDAKGMDVCSVDSFGVINTYDLTKAVNSYRGSTTTVDHTYTTTIDNEYKFLSTCISLNAQDSTILVGSGEAAQIAHWDTRSPTVAATTSFSCRPKESVQSGIRSFDPIYGIEWNPSKSNEFMTVHPHTIRVWDTRKMSVDSYATFHNMGNETLRKAQWSPRRSDIIAGLSVDGQVKIWKLNKFDRPADPTTLIQNPELLFAHRGQDSI